MNIYEIKTLKDMLEKIPTEKFDKFLEEFCEQIKLAKATYDLLNSMEQDSINNFSIKWIDDDKKNVNVKFNNTTILQIKNKLL